MDPTLILGGAVLLLLLGGKKKKSATKNGDGVAPNGTDPGGEMVGPNGKTPTKPTDGNGRPSGPPENLAPDAIWVSSNCETVVFGDGTGDLWWDKKGRPAAQKFIDANYNDPYEIARSMILGIAPCGIEFPVLEDGFDSMDIEFKREMFLRKFRDVYYLIMMLHFHISEMLEQEDYTVEFDDRCDTAFVGQKWVRPVAERMIRFYLDYSYPEATDFTSHEEKFYPWEGHDVKEKYTSWQDNVATAVINRMVPDCADEIMAAFKQEPWSASSYFSVHPGLEALYQQLFALVDEVDDNRPGGLEFNTKWAEQVD